MAHTDPVASSLALVSDAPAVLGAGTKDTTTLQEVANALQACDAQLSRVIEVLDRLAQDTMALEHKPLVRRPWELLARASRRQQNGALSAPRARLAALRELTARFAGAIDLLKSNDVELQPMTVVVAQSTVATHLEVCRANLLEVSNIVGNMSALPGAPERSLGRAIS